jgi:hypothetical protein
MSEVLRDYLALPEVQFVIKHWGLPLGLFLFTLMVTLFLWATERRGSR